MGMGDGEGNGVDGAWWGMEYDGAWMVVICSRFHPAGSSLIKQHRIGVIPYGCRGSVVLLYSCPRSFCWSRELRESIARMNIEHIFVIVALWFVMSEQSPASYA